MGITDENKFKVLLQYFGCKIKSRDMGIIHDWTTLTDKTSKHFIDGSFSLVLKPLSYLTKEDGFEILKLLKNNEANKWAEYINYDWTHIIETIKCEREGNWNYSMTCNINQLLVSKGYDLPHYLLSGKTLHEAGLAIYD